ncbi:MmgE/PrpD family protein [Chloroflexota bacterium]
MTFQRDLAWQTIELSYRSSIAHQLARYALAMNYSLLPENVVHQAKRSLLEALGCAIGAYEAPGRAICEEMVKEIGGTPEATVFCSGLRTSALNASLVNGFLVRYLDAHDLGGGSHNEDAIASILAVSEKEKSSGKDFLTSLVISYELGARIREATSGAKDWPADMRTVLSSPPTLGKLMGLNEEQIANAIGISASHSLPLGILDDQREEYTMAKDTRFAFATQHAIKSCMLAQRGFTGPLRVVEGHSGWRDILCKGNMDIERLVDFSGWRILKTRHKTLVTNGINHASVLGTIAICKEQDLKPEDIASVRIKVGVGEVNARTVSAKKYPRNAESATHSIFYANAMAIKNRSLGAESIKPENFTDPVVLDLIERITVETDSSIGHFQGASEITTKDGRKFEKLVGVPHGFRDDPLTDKELDEKFSTLASPYIDEKQIRKIFDTVWNAEKLDDISKLTALMIVR